MRTLVIEDDFTCRLILQSFVNSRGQVDVAATGGEGVVTFERALQKGKNYDLILLDLGLPGLDGHSVLSKIRELEEAAGTPDARRAKVVITTSHSDRRHVERALELCDAYLVKPLSKRQVHDQLISLGLIEAPGAM